MLPDTRKISFCIQRPERAVRLRLIHFCQLPGYLPGHGCIQNGISDQLEILTVANTVLKCYELKANNNTDHLLSAMVLRLLNAKALRIEEHYLEPSRLKKLIGGEGKVQQCIVIGDYDEADKRVNTRPMRTLYEIFCKAAGDDQILQPHELTRWLSRNQQEVMTFLKSIDKSMSYKEGRQKREQVRQDCYDEIAARWTPQHQLEVLKSALGAG